MNELILIGPIWDKERLLNHYSRNVEIYGKLEVIKMNAKKEIEYLSLNQVKGGI